MSFTSLLDEVWSMVPVVLFVTIICVVGSFLFYWFEKLTGNGSEADPQQTERERSEQDLARRRLELEKQWRELQIMADAETKAARAKAVAEVREASEVRYRSELPTSDLTALDKKLRDLGATFTRKSNALTVNVVALPTGNVGIEWIVDAEVAQPKIHFYQDPFILFSDIAPKGIHSLRLTPGTQSHFRILVHSGKRYCDGLQFMVPVPTQEEWDRTFEVQPAMPPPPADPEAENIARIIARIKRVKSNESLWEEARRQGHQEIDNGPGTEQEKRAKKARFDAVLLGERDEHERESK